ncbi:MAG TPA: lysylphosphatidylglycerol synthase transmembrane domain-containing protein [Polyangiaceae bacterium]|nr:lysylphosphatidylglycerol synthase transmembrane domain-containing protein [Polyangiaceae bacterium]
MDTTCLTDPKWRRMDGAVPPDPAAPEMFAEKPTESPRAFGWLREHGLTLGGSVLFVGGLIWLLNAGALPVVPPADAWAGVRGWAIVAYLPIFLVVHVLRCSRWTLLIPREQRPRLGLTLGIGMVGYAALVLLPFRLGEAARPGLLYSRARVPLGTSAGVVGAERIVDGLVLSTMLLVALLSVDQLSPLPDHIGQLPIPAAVIPGLAWAGVIVFGCLSLGMVAFYLWQATFTRLIELVIGRVSARLAARVSAIATSLAGGLGFLRDRPSATLFGVLTLVYWALSAAGMGFLLWACGVASPTFGQAVVILGVMGLGLVVPNAPGFFGTFQISAYSAMVLFYTLDEVTRAGSAFVFVLYIVQIASILVTGGVAFLLVLRRRPARP